MSHGHFDHSGGILEFLDVNSKSSIVAPPFSLFERYSRHPDRAVKNISSSHHVMMAADLGGVLDKMHSIIE
jgi:metal-dependent hydrolase (beta-lactamase superfamily II)